jgi:NodT family efflux transporter outer membrane factor (OMF) lipoprotein
MQDPDTAARLCRPHAARLATLALAAVAGLAGCASTPGQTAPGAVDVLPAGATAWQAPIPTATQGNLALTAAAWQGLNEPLLLPLIDAAHAASPGIAQATARVARARAARVAAGAALQPQVAAVGSASHGRNTPGQATATTATAGLQAAWALDLFGAGGAGRDAAQARLQGAQAGWHEARLTVAAEVATSYTALRACEAQAEQTQADAASRDETSRLTGLSASAGFVAPADAALARAGAAQARSQAINQQAACDLLIKSLVEITALAEPDLRQRLAGGTARLPQPAPVLVELLPAALLARRPDLVDAAQAVVAAAGDQAQSQARERPQVSLQGSLAGLSVRSGDATTSGAVWSLGPLTVSFPLFDGGASAAASTAARASYDEAVALYRAQMRRAVREVEQNLVALQATALRQADAERAAVDFESALRATQARQKGGLASLLDLEAARRNAVAAKSALIDLQRERATAWIALVRALGGGWAGAETADATGRTPTAAGPLPASAAADAAAAQPLPRPQS